MTVADDLQNCIVLQFSCVHDISPWVDHMFYTYSNDLESAYIESASDGTEGSSNVRANCIFTSIQQSNLPVYTSNIATALTVHGITPSNLQMWHPFADTALFPSYVPHTNNNVQVYTFGDGKTEFISIA